jgi:hypothetical protein
MNRLQRARVCCRPSLPNQEVLVAVSAVKSEIDGSHGGHPADGVADRRSRTLAGWVLLAVIAMAGLLSSRAFGQAAADPAAIRSVPLQAAFTDRAAVAVLERAKSEGLSKADFSTQWAGYENFKRYYQQYQFGKLMDASYVAQYGEITQSILDDLDRSQKSRSPAARALSGWIVAGSKAIATNNFHPVARVNATLMLAQTDDQPADLRTAKPPVPATAALPILVQLYMGTGNPDGVRAAALQGLLRHVQLGAVTDPRFRSGIAKLALDLIESEPPAGRSPAAHAFLQRYAVDILTLLADPNTTAKTAETFVSISTQAAKPSLIAAYAASKIGRLQPGKAKVSNASKVLASWAARAAETVDQEIARIAQLDPPLAVRDQPAMPTAPTAGGSAGSMGMGMGMAMGMPGGEMMGGDYDPSMMGGMEGMMPGSDMMGGEMYGEGMLGMPGMMGTGGPPAIPQPLEIVTARRSINHVFQQLQVGVTGQRTVGPPKQPGGLMAAADPAEKQAIDAWVATFSEVATALNDKTLVDRKKFVEMLTEQSKVLKELAGIEVIDEPTNPAGLEVGNPLGAELGAAPLQPAGAGPSPASPAVSGPAGSSSGAASVAPATAPAAVPSGAPAAVPGAGNADPLADPLAAPGSDPLADPN